jgi:hypothetical protein
MQFTLREIFRFRVSLLIWLVVTVVAAVAGPFGTLDALSLSGRTLYWGVVAGGSILLSAAARRLTKGMGQGGRIAVEVGFVLTVSTIAHLANTLLFPAWSGVWDWAYLTGMVGMVTAAIHLVIWAATPRETGDRREGDAFLRRLPINLRGPLVRIEAQDHYLKVVTVRGHTLILMRLGDAMSELAGTGVQVHRSHWVATDGVARHRREGTRDLLVMSDGVEVPVSRSFRAIAQAAGFF